MKSNEGIHQVEAYWGSLDGTLWHGTIQITATSMAEALKIAQEGRLRPEDEYDHYLACAKQEYVEDYYDTEPVGDEFDEIRMQENLKAAQAAISKFL